MEVRPQEIVYPMAARQRVDGLEPRKVVVGPFLVPGNEEIAEILVDIKDSATLSAGTAAAVTSVQALKLFEGVVDNVKKIEVRNQMLTQAAWASAVLSALMPKVDVLEDDGGTNIVYHNGTPWVQGTTTAGHIFARYFGPFKPGKWYFVFHFNRITEVEPLATAFTADIGVRLITKPRDPRDKEILVMADQLFDRTKVQLDKLNKYMLYTTVANMTDVTNDANALSATAIESWRREYLLRTANQWNDSLDAYYFMQKFAAPRDVTVTFNAGTLVKYTGIRYETSPPKKNKWQAIGTSRSIQKIPVVKRTVNAAQKARQYVQQHEIYEIDPTASGGF